MSLTSFSVSILNSASLLCACVRLCWVFVAVCRLSLVAVSGGRSSLRSVAFSLRWPLVAGLGLWVHRFQQLQHVGSVVIARGLWSAKAQKLWLTGFVAPQHVESSWSRDQTHVPCIGRQILNH